MRDNFRISVLAVLALGLCGCSNYVYSEKPLFTARDSRGLPELRPGVWAGKEERDCAFEEARPLKEWPECANGVVLGRSAARAAARLTEGKGLLVAGDPMVMQTSGQGAGGRVDYQGLRATRFDERRRAVEIAIWPVQCGPPTPAHPEFPVRTTLTQTPLPGLVVRDQNCIASDPEAVRGAARASEAWDAQPARLRWVREGKR
jgi:hypothetical protein